MQRYDLVTTTTGPLITDTNEGRFVRYDEAQEEINDLKKTVVLLRDSCSQQDDPQMSNGKPYGCNDQGCIVKKPTGMRTQSGKCRCSRAAILAAARNLKAELLQLKAKLRDLSNDNL